VSTLFEIRDLCVDVMSGHLWRRHEKRLLHHVSLSVGEGQSIAYLGPNGAGKTTTFRAIFGLAGHVHGEMQWKGKPVSTESLRSHIGFLPEQPYFCRVLTPRELLAGLGRLSGMDRLGLARHINAWAERLEFADVLDKPMRTCSKGQLQRVGLAQAMIHEPELLILDEPLSGLDPLGRELVRTVLIEAVYNGASMIFSSHILEDAERICGKVIALYSGRVIYDGATSGLLGNSANWQIRLHCRGIPRTDTKGMEIRHDADGSWRISGNEDGYPFQQALTWCMQLDGAVILNATKDQPRLEDAFVHLVGEAKHRAE